MKKKYTLELTLSESTLKEIAWWHVTEKEELTDLQITSYIKDKLSDLGELVITEQAA